MECWFHKLLCKTRNRKLEHPAPSKRCPNNPLMQLLFGWTWLYLEALPVTLCYWWYFFQQTEHTSSTVLWTVCATHAALTVKKAMKSIGCKSVKCLHASCLNLAPPAIKTSVCTCLWGVWGSGFPKCSVKCWMHWHQTGKHRSKPIYVWSSVYFLPPIWAFVERCGIYQQSAFHSFYGMKAKFYL